tara:strand:- start:14478 stop:14654 length:177 start_codon:yes stop_codon:yes gene_type:complete
MPYNRGINKEINMVVTATTAAEAATIAAELRVLYAGTDWAVCILRPLFEGELYRVIVG